MLLIYPETLISYLEHFRVNDFLSEMYSDTQLIYILNANL